MRTTHSAIALLIFAGTLAAQSPEMRVVNTAAGALGGKDRILSVKTIRVDGYGQQAYQNGGGNPTGSPEAPQKWVNINGMVWTFDLEHHRMRRQQRLVQDFVFAYARNMNGDTRADQVLDGDIAFNAGGRGGRVNEAATRARRIEMLNNPVVIVRTALDSATKLSNLRTVGKVQVMDMTTAAGDRVQLATDTTSHLPAWMSWVGPDANLGDVTYTTYWTGYSPVNGVELPIGYNTVQDWRNVVWSKLYIDKNTVDGAVDTNAMIAPDAVRAAAVPVAQPPTVTVTPIVKGVWYLHSTGGSSTAFEFTDHITLFETYGSEANAEAIIGTARTLVAGKPVTQVIVSHHHFDHSGGLRAAVAEGLTVITERGNTGIFEEMAARPAKQFPDALGRNPKPIHIIPVDDKLILKDSAMEVDIYHVMQNNHMPDGIMAYIPSAKALAEGDLVDEGWDIVWWGDSYDATVKYWNLQVEKDLPVHGNIHTYAEVLDYLHKQIQNAQDLCNHVEQSHLTMQGCPVVNTF